MTQNQLFSLFFKEYQSLREGQVKPKTLTNTYGASIRSFIKVCGDRPVDSYTPLDIQLFISTRLKQVTPTSVNVVLRSLKSIGNWSANMSVLPDRNTFCRIKMVKTPEKEIRFLDRDQFQKIMDQEPDQLFKDVYMLGVLTGMRANSICGLTWSNVDLVKQQIRMDGQQMKAGRTQIIPIHESLVPMLTRRRSGANRCQFVFFQTRGAFPQPMNVYLLSHHFKRTAIKAGVPFAHFHILRKTLGSWLCQASVPIFEISRILGHSNVLVTQRSYAQLIPSQLEASIAKVRL